MKKLVIASICCVMMLGCEKYSNKESNAVIAQDTVTTVGNHSYVRLDNPIRVYYEYEKILNKINNFEKNHSDLEIIHWHTNDTHLYVQGIWIDHRPKADKDDRK